MLYKALMILAFLVMIASLAAAWQREKALHAADKATWAEERVIAEKARSALSELLRQAEQTLADDKREIANAEAKKFDALAADLRNARAGADRLQRAADAAVSAAKTAACAAAGHQDPGDPIGVLADVLGRADDRAGILATVADERGIALEGCVSEYGAVKKAADGLSDPAPLPAH